jgi:hypothetical protein
MPFNTYKDVLVTVDNLLAIEPNEIHDNISKKVKEFFKQKKDLRRVLVEQPGSKYENTITGLKSDILAGKKILAQCKKQGLEYKDKKSNYILRLPELKDYFIKISGPKNRVILKLYSQNLQYYKNPKKAFLDYDKISPRPTVKTYQTASSKFGHLRLLEAIKRYKLDKLETLSSAIVNINEEKPKSCEDRDCVFVEKILKPQAGYKIATKNYKIFTDEALRQLVIATVYAGLWDASFQNLLVNEKKGKIAIIDTEQPNNTKPKQMFHNDIKKYEWNTYGEGIKKLIQCFPEKKALIERFQKEYSIQKK